MTARASFPGSAQAGVVTAMITPRAVPAPLHPGHLPAATSPVIIGKDFADPLVSHWIGRALFADESALPESGGMHIPACRINPKPSRKVR